MSAATALQFRSPIATVAALSCSALQLAAAATRRMLLLAFSATLPAPAAAAVTLIWSDPVIVDTAGDDPARPNGPSLPDSFQALDK
eukprot:SAG11_NODE_1281_length_5311_cov_4.192441_6_plen_86_part_00